jgi:nicotinamidase-related amidase
MTPTVNPEKSAIILIDLQNDVVRGSGPFYGDLAEQVRSKRVIESASRLADGARSAGAAVFFVTVIRRRDYLDVADQATQLTVTGAGKPARQQVSLVEGTRGAQLVDELRPQSADYVLVKKRRSAFRATELDLLLRARGIDTLFVGGVATDLGVENTVREAWDRDYNIVVVEDICVASPRSAHEYAIHTVFPRMARILTVNEVLEVLGSRVSR